MALVNGIMTIPLPDNGGSSMGLNNDTERISDDSGLMHQETRYHLTFSSVEIEVREPSAMKVLLKQALERRQLLLAGQTLCEGSVTELRHYRARIPESLVHADCEASCTNCEEWDSLLYDVPSLVPVDDVEVEEGTYTYKLQREKVALACVCIEPKQPWTPRQNSRLPVLKHKATYCDTK